MAIKRIVANPADVGGTGYGWYTTTSALFDKTRVDGAFMMQEAQYLPVNFSGASMMWFHFRLAIYYSYGGSTLFEVRDSAGVVIATISLSGQTLRASAIGGGGTVNSATMPFTANTAYSYDLQVTVGATVVVNLYMNGALIGTATAANSTGTVRGNPASCIMESVSGGYTAYYSEVIIATEDTRGMRLRELRPRSFGLFQEWDGSIANIRDTDLSTGLSVEDADRRVSFGVSNLENIDSGEIINRVVAQSYAQRGESGLSQFNHFFRFRDGTVEDGAAQTLTVLGDFFVEEFANNPKTDLPWVPDDFRSLQSGVRSLA